MQSLKDMIIRHEGNKLYPYYDTTGHITIGVGRNLSSRGITQIESNELLENDLYYFTTQLQDTLASFNELDDARKAVLIDMCFNLGLKGLLKFKKLLDAIQKKDWITASSEIMLSKAANQAPNRYKELAQIIRTGNLNG